MYSASLAELSSQCIPGTQVMQQVLAPHVERCHANGAATASTANGMSTT
jgi:hypothetical protein